MSKNFRFNKKLTAKPLLNSIFGVRKLTELRLKSIFFLIIFTGFLITPALVAITKMEINIVSYFSSSEEENNDTVEFGAKPKINLLQEDSVDFAVMETLQDTMLPGFSDNFTSLYSETFSPPPEPLFI